MSEPFQGDPPGALSDPEFWILLSLDDQSRLFELLMPIVQHAGSEQREVRPRLRIEDAVEALIRLVRGGLVEIRAWPIDDSSPYDAPLLAASEVELVLRDPTSWRSRADDPERAVEYWAGITPSGEDAYVRGERMRRSESA
jgi:hypothetical protein